MDCRDCDKRDTCKKLCKEAEQFVNRDHIGRRECLTQDKDRLSPTEWPERTTIESILLLYFTDGLNQTQVAEKLYISQQYVSKIIKKYKPILVENIKKSVVSRRI